MRMFGHSRVAGDISSQANRQAECPMSLSFPEVYKAFERPLPRGHGSVESVRYRAVTARERSFSQWHCPLACERSDLRRFLP